MVKGEWYFYYIRNRKMLAMFKSLLNEYDLQFKISDEKPWDKAPMVWRVAVKCNGSVADWLCDWINGR